MFLIQASGRAVALINLLIVARLLSPEDFGLMGIVLVVASGVDTLTGVGFYSAVIQRDGRAEPYLDTAWTLEIAKGILQAVCLVALSPLVARFFDLPALTALLQVLAIRMVLFGFTSPSVALLERDLRFRPLFLLEIAQMVTYVGVTLGFAFALRNVWALVLGDVVSKAAWVVTSFLVHPYRPRLRIRWAQARELFGFGRWLLASQILTLVTDEFDDLLVGKILGPASLGIYRVSYRVANLPVKQVAQGLRRVLFPTFARLQSSPGDLRDAFRLSLQLGGLLALPMLAGLVGLAQDFADVVMGEKWVGVAPVIQGLAVFVTLRGGLTFSGSLLDGAGHPHRYTRIRLVQALLFAGLAVPLTLRWGLPGVIVAISLPAALSLLLAFAMIARILDVHVWDLLTPVLIPALGATIMLASIEAAQGLPSALWALFAKALLGIAVYAAVVWGVGRPLGRDPRTLWRRLRELTT